MATKIDDLQDGLNSLQKQIDDLQDEINKLAAQDGAPASARQKPGTGHTATPAMPAMSRPSTTARKPTATTGLWGRHARAASPAARAIAMITK